MLEVQSNAIEVAQMQSNFSTNERIHMEMRECSKTLWGNGIKDDKLQTGSLAKVNHHEMIKQCRQRSRCELSPIRKRAQMNNVWFLIPSVEVKGGAPKVVHQRWLNAKPTLSEVKSFKS